MKPLAKKSVVGLLLAAMMSSSMAIRPAEARSHSGRNLAIGVGVVAVVAWLVTSHHKHHKSESTTITTTGTTGGTGTGTTTTVTP